MKTHEPTEDDKSIRVNINKIKSQFRRVTPTLKVHMLPACRNRPTTCHRDAIAETYEISQSSDPFLDPQLGTPEPWLQKHVLVEVHQCRCCSPHVDETGQSVDSSVPTASPVDPSYGRLPICLLSVDVNITTSGDLTMESCWARKQLQYFPAS